MKKQPKMHFVEEIADETELANRIKQLKSTKTTLKSKLTRQKTYIEKLANPVEENIVDVKVRLELIEPFLYEFKSTIEHLIVYDKPEVREQYEGEYDQFEDDFLDVKVRFNKIIAKLTPKTVSNQQQLLVVRNENGENVSLTQPSFKVKLPEISVPKFDGKIENWVHFREMFCKIIIDEKKLDFSAKIHYLLNSIPDNLAKTFDKISFSEEGFNLMWETLKDRFDNLQDLVLFHIGEIFKQKSIVKDSYDDLRKLIDTYTLNLSQLKNLGQEIDKWDMIVISLLLSRLDNDTKQMWESRFIDIKRSSSELEPAKRLPTWKEFKDCLEDRCRILRHSQKPQNSRNPFQNPKSDSSLKPNTSKAFLINQNLPESNYPSNIQCSICSNAHKTFQCPQLSDLTTQQKRDKVNAEKLCHNCLRKGHQRAKCLNQGVCRYCSQKHHSILCLNSTNPKAENSNPNKVKIPIQPNPNKSNDSKSNPDPQSSKTFHSVRNPSQKHILLSTAIVNVVDKYNTPHPVRVLLDNGSESSFMSESIVEILGLPKFRSEINVSGINPNPIHIKNSVVANVFSRFTSYNKSIDCLVTPKISDVIPSKPIPLNPDIQFPKDCELADPFFNVPSKVDMIIGAEHFFEIFQIPQTQIPNSQLFLKQSKFGWIVCGAVKQPTKNPKIHCGFSILNDLQSQVKKFWEIEACESQSKFLSNEEKYCEELFVKTTKQDPTGRFVVTLPIKSNIEDLPAYKNEALRSFYQLESRLEKQPEMKSMYVKFMEEYIELNHMEEVVDPNKLKTHSYVPHHCVLKPDSSTTPLRVVFNASFKRNNLPSLNDCLCVGPSLQPEVFAQLLKSRKYEVYMTCDMEKMYRQILTNQTNISILIFYRKSKEEPIKTYRLLTVTYGTTPGSYLAIRCMIELAKKNSAKFPKASLVLQKDLYMDDIASGDRSIENAKQLRDDVILIVSQAQMKLRKWISNRPEVLEDLPIEDCQQINPDKYPKILGVIWNPIEDVYSIDVKTLDPDKPVTKRIVLSESTSTFDPTGEFNPVVIVAKIFLQNLWNLKITWDEPLPKHFQDFWNEYRRNLVHLSDIKLNRYLLIEDYTEVEVHGFADSSERAYGACIYLRSKNSLNQIKMSLLTAKSRVAPLQKQTLARLELCAAELLAVLYDKVLNIMDLEFSKHVLWSDSMIVLSWIRTQPNKLNTFVANRVSRIQTLTKNCQWFHIKGSDNPADILSRGCTPQDLKISRLWWKGPDFLQRDIQLTPDPSEIMIDLPEMKPDKSIAFKIVIADNTINKILRRSNDTRKNQRHIAYMIRYCKYLKQKDNPEPIKGPLKVTEFWNAETVIIKHLQEQCFPEEYQALKNSQEVDCKSPLKSLSPFLDIDGLIRVGGRIKNSDFSFNFRHQILLPNHKFTLNLIRDLHTENMHLGQRSLLSVIRHRYWVIRARNKVRKICYDCVHCAKIKPSEIQQLMGQMPPDRLTSLFPFHKSGVDYAGPIKIKFSTARNASSTNGYIALFVDMVTKAVHLEVVSDLSTDAFIAALDRFFSVRGFSEKIYSDNAKNFIGANNELKEIVKLQESQEHQEKVIQHCAQKCVQWHFIPPRAPNFGGLWESQVKVMKYFLVRILGDALLTFEELYTVIKKIEAIMNSRPLTPESEDPSDLRVLTPGHFLIGRPLISKPERSFVDVPMNRLTRFRRIQSLSQQVWKRFNSEYISQLQQLTKNYKNTVDVQPGDLVMLKDENPFVMSWDIARILETYPGKDNVTRVVKVKTKKGEYVRPISKIALLPIDKFGSPSSRRAEC